MIALAKLPFTVKSVPGEQTLVATGDRPSFCCLVIDGFVQRSKIIEDRRQILSFHQPGDMPDLQCLQLHVQDHELETLGNCVIGLIPHDPIRSLMRSRSNLADALWRDLQIDAAVFREWICNVGQRSAPSRLAHLVLELYSRLLLIDRVDELSFSFPASQHVLAEAIGVSDVHLNRCVKELRKQGLLEIARGKITIFDLEGLRKLAGFDCLYLHLDPAA